MVKLNKDIYNEVSRLVKGHDNAKKILINQINRSYLRYTQKWKLELHQDDLIETQNVLLIGDSGTGKTHLVESLQKVMGFPLMIVNATSLNPTGSGKGLTPAAFKKAIEDRAKEILEEQHPKYFSIDGVLEQMIVFVDELDKLCTSFGSSENWNQQIQNNFLSIFENKAGLTGVSFIFAGAFVGMEKEVIKAKSIGFSKLEDSSFVDETDYEEEVIKFGMIPELVGRITHTVRIDKLNEDDYRNILFNVLLPQKRRDMKCYQLDNLTLSKAKIDSLIETTLKSKQGVRKLKKELDKLVVDLEFNSDDPDTAWLSLSV